MDHENEPPLPTRPGEGNAVEISTSLGAAFGKVLTWALRHPLPPAASAMMVSIALVLAALPLAFPNAYVAALQNALPNAYSQFAADIVQRGTSELQKQVRSLEDQLAAMSPTIPRTDVKLKVKALFETSINEP